MALEIETEFFEQNRKNWLEEHEGERVAIFREEVAGFFPDYAEAYAAGVEKFGGDVNFLVKEVLPDPIHTVFWDGVKRE